ncbi:MAG: hypothetical protein WD059_12235 [Balneolaceae bacterium]
MDNLPRFIFFASGVVVISAAFILLTSELLVQTAVPSWAGILFLLGYGLVYMNLVFVSSRRFMRRLHGPSVSPYIFSVLIALPPLIWVNIYDAGLGKSNITFMITIIIGCGLGAYLGHRAGLKAQDVFWENLQKHIEQDEKTPDNLKRPHDNLNKN